MLIVLWHLLSIQNNGLHYDVLVCVYNVLQSQELKEGEGGKRGKKKEERGGEDQMLS